VTSVVSEVAAVSVRNVSLSFDGVKQVLSDITLDVAPGEFVALVGPSGCGKTTLLNLCAGLIAAPSLGDLRVCGRAAALGNRKVAYMLARDSLLPWVTALENAAFGLSMHGVPAAECRSKAMQMLARVGLSDYGSSYPKALSHGMRQRVALARTFALDADLMLMDEPFGALDAQTRLMMQESLLQIWSEVRPTVVFVTHDIDEAIFLADRIVVMSASPGRIIREITVDLSRPRAAEMTLDASFVALKRQCMDLIRTESLRAFEQQTRGANRD
jgi:NitT/TauT family transport system ATP-binding protein